VNIIITGEMATGKTNLQKLIGEYLKGRGDEVLLIEEVFTDHKPKDFGIGGIDKSKGNVSKHLIFTVQDVRYLVDCYVGEFDIAIHLGDRKVGQWLYQMLPAHEPPQYPLGQR